MGSGQTAEVLRDPTFVALAREAVADYLDWEQLLTRPLPAGMSAAETWELLGVVRRLSGTAFPIPAPDGRELWHGLNQEALRCLGFIRRHCRTDSHLNELLLTRHGHRFLVRSRIAEAIATCRLDGVLVDPERADRILRGAHAPQSPVDRLVVNSYRMLEELDDLAAQPFEPALIQAIYERLTRDVDLTALPRGPRHTIVPAADHAGDPADLQAVCDYANGVIGDPYEAAAIKGYMIRLVVTRLSPLPDLNETVARHLLRVFAVQRHYPVLGCLPVSATTLRWFEGDLEPGAVRFATLTPSEVPAGSIDLTREMLTHLQLVTAAISELLAFIEAADAQDAAVRAAVHAAPDLNYRQRAILGRALECPDAEFRIREHQTANRVVYQTARSDLLELESRGYLRRVTKGKAFVFVPADTPLLKG